MQIPTRETTDREKADAIGKYLYEVGSNESLGEKKRSRRPKHLEEAREADHKTAATRITIYQLRRL